MDRRLTLKALAGSLLALPLGLSAARALAMSEQERILATVHPQLRDFVRKMFAMSESIEPLGPDNLIKHREFMESWAQAPLADITHLRRVIPGLAGQPDVEIHVINAGQSGQRPAILHTHGGGFVAGTAKAAIPDLQKLCRTLDCVAVTVEYRLAPETTSAGSIEDNYAALKWLHGNAESLGVDENRIAVMGESAGGGHAALLAITARDRGEVPVFFQCLTYPMLDDRTGSSRAVPNHVGHIIWNAESNRFGWGSFLGMTPGWAGVPARAVPARVTDLAGLPPAFIGVGSIDLFHDEDVDYAQALNNAGVTAELIVVPGAFHGFDNPMIRAPITQNFISARLDALRRGLGG